MNGTQKLATTARMMTMAEMGSAAPMRDVA
jgi:hypothetical protein